MRKLFLSTLSAALAVTAACGGDSPTGPSSVAGTYSLATVNSAPLPYVYLNDASGKFEIVSDVYVISENGTYTNPTIVRSTVSGTVTADTLTSNGTYTRSGNSITLTDAADPTSKLSGAVTTSGLTITAAGFILVYQRSGS